MNENRANASNTKMVSFNYLLLIALNVGSSKFHRRTYKQSSGMMLISYFTENSTLLEDLLLRQVNRRESVQIPY
jgi:hypothetical protein